MAQESRISIKALLVGTVVDLVGSSLFGLIWGFCVAVIKAGQGDTFSEKSFYSMEPWALLIVSFIGLCYTALGGYVAAMMAKRSQLLHGAIVGGLTLPWFLVGTSAVPSWCLVVGVLGVIPFEYSVACCPSGVSEPPARRDDKALCCSGAARLGVLYASHISW